MGVGSTRKQVIATKSLRSWAYGNEENRQISHLDCDKNPCQVSSFLPWKEPAVGHHIFPHDLDFRRHAVTRLITSTGQQTSAASSAFHTI